MMMNVSGLLLGGALLVAVYSDAVLAVESAELKCGSEFKTAQEISRCMAKVLITRQKQLDEAKHRLTQTMTKVKKAVEKEGIEFTLPVDSFRAAEQAWRHYRAQNCRYYAVVHAPLGDPDKEAIACKIRMTSERTEELTQEESFWRQKFLE